MDAAQFENRFLEFVYRTNTPITAGAVAYYAQCTIEESQGHLDRLAGNGTITLDSDDSGNIYFVFPNRPSPMPNGAMPTPPQALQQYLPHSTPSGSSPHVTHSTPSAGMQIGGYQVPSAQNGHIPQTPHNLDGSKACYFCGEVILAVARKCKHCGEILDQALQQRMAPVQVNVGVQHAPQAAVAVASPHSPGVAAVLSFLWPGLGQMYCGRVGAGLGWMFAVFIGYLCLLIPGFILHIICIFSAASTARLPAAR